MRHIPSAGGKWLGGVLGSAIGIKVGKGLVEKATTYTPQYTSVHVPKSQKEEELVKLLLPRMEIWQEVSLLVMERQEYRFVKGSAPYVIVEILHQALSGICITNVWRDPSGEDDLFSLVTSDGMVNLEVFHATSVGFRFYRNKQLITEEEALITYKGLLTSYLESLGHDQVTQ